MVLDLSELVLRPGEADPQSFDFAVPAFAFGFGDAVFEDVAVLVVDIDGATAFIGMASIPESGSDPYSPVLDALLATTIDD